MPPRTAQLSVRRKLQPDLLLPPHQPLDFMVLQRLELGGRDRPSRMPGARLLDGGGTQQAADMVGAEGGSCAARCHPHTSFASSATIPNFAHCSLSARTLPSSVEAKPHWGDNASCSSATYLVASSMRRLMSTLCSSVPTLVVISPSTTILSPRGRNRNGSKPPARSLSYSRK